MKARIDITLRSGILDPQGQAIAHALQGLGFDGVQDARQGKLIEITLSDGTDPAAAQKQLETMCQQLLANPIMEDFKVQIVA